VIHFIRVAVCYSVLCCNCVFLLQHTPEIATLQRSTLKWITWQSRHALHLEMTDSTANATHPQSTQSWDPNSPVQIEIKPKFQFQFVPRDTEESEFLNLVDFGDVAFLVETVMRADFWEISTTYFNFAVWVCVDARFRVCLIFIRHFLQKSPILSGSCIPVTSTLLCVCV